MTLQMGKLNAHGDEGPKYYQPLVDIYFYTLCDWELQMGCILLKTW